jgi:hypothetical protein
VTHKYCRGLILWIPRVVGYDPTNLNTTLFPLAANGQGTMYPVSYMVSPLLTKKRDHQLTKIIPGHKPHRSFCPISMTMCGHDFATCQPNLTPHCDPAQHASDPKVEILTERGHLMSYKTRYNHRRSWALGNRHSGATIYSIIAWHSNFIMRTHIITMITLTSDKVVRWGWCSL